MSNGKSKDPLVFDCHARSDFRFYALLVIGAVFVYAGATIDPARNCSQDGECAPWLVPIAFWMGVLASVAAAANLIKNPRWGSRVDDATRSLICWNEFYPTPSMTIPLDDIARIRVETQWEDHRIMLFGPDGSVIAVPGANEVIPWPKEEWARTLAARYPHIAVDVTG